MKQKVLLGVLAALMIAVAAGAVLMTSGLAQAQESRQFGQLQAQATISTTLSYQGRLSDNGSPANGLHDFQFKLYDSSLGGTQIGSTLTQSDVQVDDGNFVVPLGFGDVFNGEPRYLEIGVRPSGEGGEFTVLEPRQSLAPVPYALWARSTASKEVWRLKTDVAMSGDGTMSQGTVNFVPSSMPKTIKTVKIRIPGRGDSGYNGSVTGTFEKRDFADNMQETLVSNIDLKTAPVDAWTTLTLSGSPVISPDQALWFHVVGNGDSGLFLCSIYIEIEVE